MRKTPFVISQFYHVYNRGVDKRDIFTDKKDLERFIESIKEFNVVEPIGSIYEKKFGRRTSKNEDVKHEQLVQFICYCINPNHFHFLLEEIVEGGISEFMKRLGGGYAKYFNERHARSGALFQGKFKSIHVDSNPYLLHLSAYINLNYRVHQLGRTAFKLMKSSFGEYIGKDNQRICKKDMILGQFDSVKEYEKFANESLQGILERRYDSQVEDIEEMFLE